MKSRNILRSIFFAVTGLSALAPGSGFAGDVYNGLSQAEQKIIQSGRQVSYFDAVKGEVWPRMRIYQRIDATPEEAMAVFSDYSLQHEYVHRVAGSVPYNTPNPAMKVIDYTMHLPDVVAHFFDPHYRLVNVIKNLGPDKGYQMEWRLHQQAKSISRLEGQAVIEPLPGGSTLIAYVNMMEPNLHGYGMITQAIIKSQLVIDAVKRGGGEALQSIVDRVQKVKTERQSLLDTEVQNLRNCFESRPNAQ